MGTRNEDSDCYGNEVESTAEAKERRPRNLEGNLEGNLSNERECEERTMNDNIGIWGIDNGSLGNGVGRKGRGEH